MRNGYCRGLGQLGATCVAVGDWSCELYCSLTIDHLCVCCALVISTASLLIRRLPRTATSVHNVSASTATCQSTVLPVVGTVLPVVGYSSTVCFIYSVVWCISSLLLLRLYTVGHFTFCPLLYSQSTRGKCKCILIIVGIYMSLNIYYYYTRCCLPRSPGQPQHHKYQNRIWW